MKIRISLAFALALSTNLALAAVPTNKDELSKTTLTALYNHGLSDIKSAYQLEEVTEANPASNFTITKFWNDNGTLKAVEYNVVFNEILGSGAASSYYMWQVVDGKLTLVEGSAGGHDIKVGAEGVITTRQSIGSGLTTAYDSSFVGISSTSNGGAISNSGTISSITGLFIANNITKSNAYGGAIYNASSATIGDITANFIGNYATSSSSNAYGGAIYNATSTTIGGTIGDITGDFIGNYATGSTARGGAIYNSSSGTIGGTIGDITGDFIGNYATSSSNSACGGAIYNNNATITSITGDFIENYATSDNSNAYGGAIYNTGSSATIGDITGDFIGNYATSSSNNACGGAIYNNNATITSITGDFIGNYATGDNGNAYGGAIYNTGSSATIGDITGGFIGNYATGSTARGGAIYNSVSDSSTKYGITGDFIGNYATGSTAQGGAIYNSATSGSASTLGDITGDFIGNYATGPTAQGGAIYNSTTFIRTCGITGDFIGNYATGSTAEGGAIYNEQGTINIREGSSFTGNYVSTDEGATKSFEAIYNYTNSTRSATINFNACDSIDSIIVNDGINGTADYKAYQSLNINDADNIDTYGTVEFNSFVNNQTVNVHNGSLKLGAFEGARLNVNGTELEVAATSASLTNTDINVKAYTTLLVASNATMSSSSNINLASGSELNIGSGASLSLDDSSELVAANYTISKPAEVELAMLATANETPASSISGENATLSADKIENANISNLALSASADMELKNSTLSNGTTVTTNGNTLSLNQATLTAGASLDDVSTTNAASGLTITGTLEGNELNITSLTFDLASLGTESKLKGQHTLLSSTGTTINLSEEALTGSNTNFNYSFTLNANGELVVNTTLTTIVVSGVSYDAVAGWTLSVDAEQYELLDLNKSSFSGNFLFSAEALAQFELVKGLDGTPEWMESYSVAYGGDSVSSDNLSGNVTMNGVAAENGKYRVAYIPEPSTVTLSLLALAGLAARRCRKVA